MTDRRAQPGFPLVGSDRLSTQRHSVRPSASPSCIANSLHPGKSILPLIPPHPISSSSHLTPFPRQLATDQLASSSASTVRQLSRDDARKLLGGPGAPLGVARVRFLPKRNGVRPIVNLSAPSHLTAGGATGGRGRRGGRRTAEQRAAAKQRRFRQLFGQFLAPPGGVDCTPASVDDGRNMGGDHEHDGVDLRGEGEGGTLACGEEKGEGHGCRAAASKVERGCCSWACVDAANHSSDLAPMHGTQLSHSSIRASGGLMRGGGGG